MIGGLTRDLEAGIDRWNSGGNIGHFGLASNAALTGLFENFQGKVFSVFDGAGPTLTYSRLITAAATAHIVVGSSQYLVAYASEAAISSGFVNASTSIRTVYADGALIVGNTYTILTTGDSNFVLAGAASNTVGVTFVALNAGVAGKTGTVTSLVTVPSARGTFRANLLQTVAGKQAVALIQGNALWIPATTSFKAYFDINADTNPANAKAISFSQFGVVGSQGTIANCADAAKEIGDGSAFIQIELAASKGKLRVRTATSATILESAAFTVPTGAYSIGFEYNLNASTGNIAVRVNDLVVATMQATVTGPLQVFARGCHGASYDPTLHTQKILEIDTALISVPAQS